MTQPSPQSPQPQPQPSRADGQSIRTGSDLVPAARRAGENVVASVRGEIDLHNSPELRDVLLNKLIGEASAPPKKLVLNLEQVPYMDSSAIAVLVESLRKVQRGGGKIYLTNLQPRVKGLLEIARLNAIFVIAASEDEALKK
jgi:anti-anti-sigma factor